MTSESGIGQGLLTLTRGFQAGSSKPKQAELIHLLSIEFGSMAPACREAMRVTYDEQLAWMTAAAERGCSLVVLRTAHSIEFYTTHNDRFVALRSAIEAFAARVQKVTELGGTRTLQLTGTGAARHLFTYAAQPDVSSAGPMQPAARVRRAAMLSAASTALGPAMASLFRAAANVAVRVRSETLLEDSSTCSELREIEAMAAERVVEEELATWQAREAETRRTAETLPAVVTPDKVQFEGPEPSSEVRLRVGTAIRPSISYVLEPKSVSS